MRHFELSRRQHTHRKNIYIKWTYETCIQMDLRLTFSNVTTFKFHVSAAMRCGRIVKMTISKRVNGYMHLCSQDFVLPLIMIRATTARQAGTVGRERIIYSVCKILKCVNKSIHLLMDDLRFAQNTCISPWHKRKISTCKWNREKKKIAEKNQCSLSMDIKMHLNLSERQRLLPFLRWSHKCICMHIHI